MRDTRDTQDAADGTAGADAADVLRAVRARLGARGARAAAEVGWSWLVECDVIRSTESRTQTERREPGPVDLTGHPRYDTLAAIEVPPPADPRAPARHTFVLRDSPVHGPCGCAGGRVPCAACAGGDPAGCPECAGAGTVDDPACGGLGSTTAWTEAAIRHTPRYDNVMFPGDELPGRVRRAAHATGVWHEDVLGHADPLPDRLPAHHRGQIAKRLHRLPDEITREAVVRHLRIAHVTTPATPGRVHYVFPGRRGTEIITVRRDRSRGRAVGAGLGAALALALVVLGLVRVF